MLIKHCLICKSPIKTYPSNKSSKKTCSRKCYSIWAQKTGIHAGKNNASYKGGKIIDTTY